jgi:hypothetical protein
MNTETYLETDIVEGDIYEPYRALSKAAVVSLIVAVFSLLALATPLAVVIPLAGVLMGWRALVAIRQYPDELTGRGLAWTAIALNAALFLGGSTFHAVVYATEVPEGAQRISFRDLQPRRDAPELPVSPRALELDGQRVFIKGYLYPDGQQHNIKRFILVPDMGTCCFGGQPKLTDMIQVTLRDPLRAHFAIRKRSLAGVLHVDTELKAVSGLGGVYYQLDADHFR